MRAGSEDDSDRDPQPEERLRRHAHDVEGHLGVVRQRLERSIGDLELLDLHEFRLVLRQVATAADGVLQLPVEYTRDGGWSGEVLPSLVRELELHRDTDQRVRQRLIQLGRALT